MARHENKLIITYTGMNKVYLNGKLMYIAGRENAGPDDLGTIVAPLPAQDVSIEGPDEDNPVPDPVLFSYANTVGGKARLRVVLVKIYSKAGFPSTCTVSVYVPSVDGDWISKTEDVTLKDKLDGNIELLNPHGMADVGDSLCFIDYETRRIFVVTESALESAGDGATLPVETVSMEDYLDNEYYRGQAIIALGGKVYALYIYANIQATEFEASKLFMLGFDSTGKLAVENQTVVGINAQTIIPVMDNDGKIWLVVPAIGGRQNFDGTTNGIESNICVVEAAAEPDTWPEEAEIKITSDPMPESKAGDPTPPEATTYNIIAVGAAMRSGSSKLFILTQVYTDGAASAFWILYQTTVSDFLALSGTPAPTLSNATGLNMIDSGIVQSTNVPPDAPYSVYFWDLLYEQSHRNNEEEDRLWIALGSPILVTKPCRYSSPNKPNGPFIVYYCIGGENVNAMDVPIETLHQAVREVSLKRGLRGAGRTVAQTVAVKSSEK